MDRQFNGRLRLIGAAASLIGGIIFIAVGAHLIQTSTDTETNQLEVDYTDCNKYPELDVTCKDFKKTSDQMCTCQVKFDVNESLIGVVTLYYKLDLKFTKAFEDSRDDAQLSGKLSPEPAESCNPDRYSNESGTLVPIAPCGKMADMMFTDRYALRVVFAESNLNVSHYGMLENKEKYSYNNPKSQNPTEPLKNLFQNFSKPKSWSKNIWELDTEHDFNNGFQNERFIGWMDKSMKLKPVWRLDSAYGGLNNDSYVMRVDYNYPVNVYSGPREMVFIASRPVASSSGGGVAMVVLGVAAVVISLAVVAIIVKEEGWMFFKQQ